MKLDEEDYKFRKFAYYPNRAVIVEDAIRMIKLSGMLCPKDIEIIDLK